MIDGNQLRGEFGRYLAEHKATRWGMDAALMHVCKIAYDAGKADGPGAALHSREYEIEVPAEPGFHPLKFTGLPLQDWRDEQLHAHIQRGAVLEGWKEATIAWEVCASIHREYAKKKDPFFTTRQADFVKHTEAARSALLAAAPDQFRDAAKMMAEPADPDPLHLSRILHELAGAASLCWEPRPTGVFDSQLAIQFVEQALAEIRSRMTSAPSEVPMPEPVAYGIGNTAITGHTNRLMMVRLDVPLDDQYAGALWHPLVLADEARTYGERCRAAGEAAGYARGLRDAVRDAAPLVQNGEVLVTVTGLTGSGKSAIAGEIEIMCRALGLEVEWGEGAAEKHLTHADWTNALEMYRPRVRIVEANIPRTDAALAKWKESK